MSMQKLRGIKSVGAYTPQRSVAEKLLLIEDNLLRNLSQRKKIAQHMENADIQALRPIIQEATNSQLKEKKIKQIIHEDLRQYLQISLERKINWPEICGRGAYASELFNHLTGDQPFEIDFENQSCDWLFCGLNNERPINIQNLNGDWNFCFAGAYNGQATINAENLNGGWNFNKVGIYEGKAIINVQNITGHRNFEYAGAYRGKVTINAQNFTGDRNFQLAGGNDGEATFNAQKIKGSWNFNKTGESFPGTPCGKILIIAKEIYGQENFKENNGTLIIQNPGETPIIEGVINKQRKHILHLIAQNTPSEEIMDYLRRST